MKVLLLLAVVAAVGQCALLGSKKCTYGPSYWCSHVDHAKECGAMQHCMTTVWKNQRIDMIGSTETCFDVIKVLDVVRRSSDADFKDQWNVGCTGMPVSKRQLCKDLIRTNTKEVVMLLKSDLTSRQVASALKLCGGFVDTVPRHEQVKVTGDYCKDCENFVGDLRDLFKNSEGEAEALVKSMICAKAGPLQSLCDQMVDQYGKMVFNMIYQRLDPEVICSALQMCSNQTRAALMNDIKSIMARKQRGAAECDVCKSVAGDLQAALKDKTLQNDITSALENDVCPLLGSFAAQCKTYVASYAPLVFQLAVAELDPQTFCQEVGLCNATKSDSGKLIHVPLGTPVGAVQVMAPVQKVEGVECDICKEVVKKIMEKIEESKTVEVDLDKLCQELPNSMSKECTALVNKYGPQIIDYVLNKVNPDEICKMISYCSSMKRPHPEKKAVSARTSFECEICVVMMKEVQGLLNSTKAKTLEEKALEELCSKLPKSVQGECNLFVVVYYPAIANMIAEEADPTKLCTLMELCGKSKSSSKVLKFLPMMDLRPAARRPLLGERNKCLYGPSFWCASEENARLCQAEEHCRKMKNKLDG